jgi:IS30 family transposase
MTQKLTPSDRLLILTLHKDGSTMAEIARMMNCSPTTVRFTLYPEKLAEMNEKQAIKRQGAQERERNRERVRKCREKKKIQTEKI